VRLPTGVSLPQLAMGALHSCGLTAGQAWCWGRNATGQLGNNATANRRYPVAVQQGAVTFTSLTAGQEHTCGLTYGGATHCWGGNARGQVGDATGTTRLTPVAVQQPAGATFTSVSAGLLFTCGVRQYGQGYCWGANASGQVGDSTQVDRAAPVPSWN
jgi:alpha-tubulin suppressor-like RCC1 family protein